MPDFVPGLELSRAFYREVVEPMVRDLPHSAALLGTGSEVLGLDTARSTDHGWGPRLQLFVDARNVECARESIAESLPETFRGWPTRFGWDQVPVSDHVDVAVLEDWLRSRLGFDPRDGVPVADWLATPQQVLLELTQGAVYRDEGGELAAVREALAWYPDDVWLWLLACQWRRIDQEEPFVGRAAEVGDEVGSRIVTARLVRDVVRLCFLLERRYAPYGKWLGSAFRRLDAYDALGDSLLDALAATDYPAREEALVRAVQTAARLHNALGVTRRPDEVVGLFHERPYCVLGAGRFVDACLERVTDPWLLALPLVGGVDQFADSTDVLSDAPSYQAVVALYEAWIGRPREGAAT